MNVDRLAATAMVRAPAKLNLFFEILAKRSDGYHEIETLMVPVSLYDTLVASADPSGQIHVSCRWGLPGDGASALGELPAEADNLATKAAGLLQQRAGIKQGLRIDLVKRIPAAAGLGGGSSDAAATLLAANAVWTLGYSRAALAALAGEIGSDVPFFLVGGPAICRGRGERVEPLRTVAPIDCVVVRPPEGLSTASVYARSRVPEAPAGVEPLVEALARGDARQLGQSIHNRLEEAAESLTPWIGRLRREFERMDCLAAQLCGSGSAYFGICRHARHARRVAGRLRARGIGQVYAVSTSN
jgi:4-diphosphocytidyl-2-C-methyl-D-erythritol kinase